MNMRILLLVFLIPAGVILLCAAGLIAFLMITEFKPPRRTVAEIKGSAGTMEPAQREFTLLTWNIGYAGLGAGEDFFYDGGRSVMPGREQSNRYLEGICNMLGANDTVDFIFVQEADRHSKRSWYRDEVEEIKAVLPGHAMAWAVNYDCRFVPMPPFSPMGRVVSGLATWTKFKPEKAETVYFDAYFPWPKRIVFLKRCFITLRFRAGNGHDLVIINTHNSAYDSSGILRRRELEMLDSAMMSEYRKGNFVVAGGDWNINPRGFREAMFPSGDPAVGADTTNEQAFVPGWQFAFDPSGPSNRNVNMPYKKGVTKATIIDFFVVSPNVEVLGVKKIPADFAFSDHEPVIMKIKLK